MKNKMKIMHIIIIIIGIIFITLSACHSNLWFDEAYSVSIANHDYKEIWTIGGHDVHPIFYYWILHTISLIFGSNILVYRLFSVLMIAILGVLGYTHIRRDFGDKVGMLFSFLVFFLPVNLVYAGEIRMYSLAMLLVTLTAIYAYRIYRSPDKKNIKNWILFAIFGLTSAYTHYYALIAVGIINILLFIFFVLQAKKEKKITYSLKTFILSGIIQIVAYLPWILYLLLQMKQVSSGFWIGIKFPDTLIEFFTFQFTGNLGNTLYTNNILAGLFGIFICIYIIHLWRNSKKYKQTEETKQENQSAKFAIGIYGGVILIACLMSLILWRPIIYARYMLCVTGIFIFFLAYMMAKKGNKYIILGICTISVLLSLSTNINLINTNYDKTNEMPFSYLENNLLITDIILHGNEGSGFVVSTKYPQNKEYFWDQQHWNVEEAYKAFSKDRKTIYQLDDLKDYTGRILIVDTDSYEILEKLHEKYDITIIDQKEFKTSYKNFVYPLVLVEKH